MTTMSSAPLSVLNGLSPHSNCTVAVCFGKGSLKITVGGKKIKVELRKTKKTFSLLM